MLKKKKKNNQKRPMQNCKAHYKLIAQKNIYVF